MDKKLILHIGSHKTGTTSIQAALYQNKKSLEKQGFSLFYHSANGVDSKDGHPGLWTLTFDEVSRGVFIRPDLAKALSRLPETVVMSQENFSWVVERSELEKFNTRLRQYFSDIQIIAYIRRQDMQMVSHHQQGSKNPNLLAARLFGSRPRALSDVSEGIRLYLDYNERFAKWANVFGDENISLRIFDKNILKDGDSVADFSYVSGIQFPIIPERKNESNGFEVTKINHLMNQVNISMPLRNWIHSYLDNSGKLMPSQTDACQFYQQFKEGNKALNARFKISSEDCIFSEDFAMYSEHAEDIWTEDSANSAILHLLKAFKTPKFVKKDDLLLAEKVALALKETNPSASQKIKSIFNL